MKKQSSQSILEWVAGCPARQVFIAMGVFGGIVYAAAVSHPFVHDDIFFLVENPALRHFDFWKSFFHPLDMGIIGSGANTYYRPLLDLVNHVQYVLFGLNPHGFHFFNICLHLLNGFLVYSVILRMLQTSSLTQIHLRCAALITALVFLIHPIQTQAVDCVSGISNLLFVFLGLSACLLYLESRRDIHSRRAGVLYGLSLMLLGLSVFAKEQALVFPLLLAWFEICFADASSGMNRRKTIVRVAGWFLVMAAYVLLKKLLMGSQPLLGGHVFSQEFWLRVLSIPHILLVNLSLILFPKDLHYFRSINILDPWMPSAMMLSALVLAGAMIYRRVSPAMQRVMVFGLGWFLLAQALTINILPLIWEYSYVSAAEHFLYLPMIGCVLPCAAAFMEYFPSKSGDEGKTIILILLVACLSVLTIKQHVYWQSEVRLFERAAYYEPQIGRVQMLLGKAYYSDGKFIEAAAAYAAARDRMNFYERAARSDHAKALYRVMLRDINHGLAVSYQAVGDFPSAETYFLEALQWAPDDVATHNDLGVLYEILQKNDAAQEHFRRAFEQNPENEMFAKNYAMGMAAAGQKDEALDFVRKTLSSRLNRQDFDALLKGIESYP